jgi:hypothetical protein
MQNPVIWNISAPVTTKALTTRLLQVESDGSFPVPLVTPQASLEEKTAALQTSQAEVQATAAKLTASTTLVRHPIFAALSSPSKSSQHAIKKAHLLPYHCRPVARPPSHPCLRNFPLTAFRGRPQVEQLRAQVQEVEKSLGEARATNVDYESQITLAGSETTQLAEALKESKAAEERLRVGSLLSSVL